ncbi:MAG: toll/interleukin-1 receptor domain-containing protein [Clostridiales bacterium]|nr:toll/interleukin-1 receptor domain-containing protein [Clostridiales bacterium]
MAGEKDTGKEALKMRDVFISYSTNDQEIADEVCAELEHEELDCWIASRARDLQPGKEYPERIREAIESSKVFVILLSASSMATKQVLQEVTLANDRQKYGMSIFPVIVDAQLTAEEVKRYAGYYVLAGKEFARWSDGESRQELIRQITLRLSSTSNETAEIRSNIPECGAVIGRERELQAIADALQQCGRLCLTGIGGIGKTALLQEFCHSRPCQTAYKTIVYLPLERCLLRTIANDRVLNLVCDGLAEKKRTLSSHEYSFYKLSLLENSVDEQTLIVLDNVEYSNDPLLDRVCSLNCSVVVATRYADKRFSQFRQLTVDALQSMKSVHELFELYYGERLEEGEYVFLDRLLADVRYHTMTVILLAKQMSYFRKYPHDYQNKNQLRTERTNNLTQIMSDSMNDSNIAAMYTQLFDLFGARSLTDSERKIMKTMCVLPTEGIYTHLYVQLVGEELVPTITSLEHMGWIQNNSDRTILMLHPLVRDVVTHELEIHMEDPDIGSFVSRFVALISNSWNKPYQENLAFKELALSIYFQFPTPSLARYKDYLTLSKLLWVLDCMDTGLEIQNKVKLLFVDPEGKHAFSAEEAETFLQIGFTYQGKGDYANAAEELGNAARIYGNRYAASLSHLAQAYMAVGEKSIEEIEPLLKESLAIREKYWPGTISEAASCHLYAKTLSAYQTKLDFAIQLEKRAHNIFSRLQPGGVNVSSTAYILGWLYVQTAEDADDLEFGIEKLEEAKRIRLKHRGDPLHSWMEDVYLKLGLAYEKINNDSKAKEYFELLLQVRTNKYRDNPVQTPLIQSYRLLQDVYARLGDKDGEKKCKKYLRYHV